MKIYITFPNGEEYVYTLTRDNDTFAALSLSDVSEFFNGYPFYRDAGLAWFVVRSYNGKVPPEGANARVPRVGDQSLLDFLRTLYGKPSLKDEKDLKLEFVPNAPNVFLRTDEGDKPVDIPHCGYILDLDREGLEILIKNIFMTNHMSLYQVIQEGNNFFILQAGYTTQYPFIWKNRIVWIDANRHTHWFFSHEGSSPKDVYELKEGFEWEQVGKNLVIVDKRRCFLKCKPSNGIELRGHYY